MMKGKTYEKDVDIASGGETVTVVSSVPDYTVRTEVTTLEADNSSATSPNRITLEEYDPDAGTVVRDQSFPISQDEGQTIGEESDKELFRVKRGKGLRVTGDDEADVQLRLRDEK